MDSKAQKTASRRFDLEERLLKFSKEVRLFLKQIPRTRSNIEDVPQLVRSSGSIGANYIEANEYLGKKDLLMRIKIAKKEAKESQYWLNLIDTNDNPDVEELRTKLIKEADEIVRILASIYIKISKAP
jgi:four helix bundle protein